MHQSNFIYHDKDQPLHGYLTYDDSDMKPRPAVLVVHDWSGRNDFACAKADMLAQMGYLGFAVDMYGEGRLADTLEQKKALMAPLVNDRLLLKSRIESALDTVRGMAEVDNQRIAAIGFCFGGLCVLDLARTGVSISGVVSFHGLLNQPDDLETQKIQAKILALHGYDDPMVPPEQLEGFCQEMNEAQADWQVHVYGNTQHAFTNPKAHDKDLGTIYNPAAEQRAFQAMENFLQEIFDSGN